MKKKTDCTLSLYSPYSYGGTGGCRVNGDHDCWDEAGDFFTAASYATGGISLGSVFMPAAGPAVSIGFGAASFISATLAYGADIGDSLFGN